MTEVPGRAFLVLIAILALGGWVYSIHRWTLAVRRRSGGHIAEATAVDCVELDSEGRRHWQWTVSYTTRTGVRCGDVPVKSRWPVRPGDRFPVVYGPQRPRDASPWSTGMMIAELLLVFPVATGWTVLACSAAVESLRPILP